LILIITHKVHFVVTLVLLKTDDVQIDALDPQSTKYDSHHALALSVDHLQSIPIVVAIVDE